MHIEKGLIQVYTGNGKGKTTAVVGLAVRARGHNLKVCYIYFHKDPAFYGNGEYEVLEKCGVKIYGFARKCLLFNKGIKEEDMRKECLEGLEFIKKLYQENEYNLLILDEVFISLKYGFLKEREILEIMDLKPENLELVLTGRGATKKIRERADLVSEIKKIKHYYDLGIERREGIEY